MPVFVVQFNCVYTIDLQENAKVNSLYTELFSTNILIYIWHHSSIQTWWMLMKFTSKENKDLPMSCSQEEYHVRWCPGDVRSQGINSHSIEPGSVHFVIHPECVKGSNDLSSKITQHFHMQPYHLLSIFMATSCKHNSIHFYRKNE